MSDYYSFSLSCNSSQLAIKFLEKANTEDVWSEKGLSLQAIVSKPNFSTLRLELRPTWRSPGDRSLYIMDDGRINVF